MVMVTFIAMVLLVDSGADYAEYFQTKDGNSIAVGKTVVLDGDKE